MTDSEIYYPQVYCERCANYRRWDQSTNTPGFGNGNYVCVITGPRGQTFCISQYKNANHDCKDYEPKDRESGK